MLKNREVEWRLKRHAIWLEKNDENTNKQKVTNMQIIGINKMQHGK